MLVLYDVLDNYEEAEAELRSQRFDGTVNPVDGVTYPDLAVVPTGISDRVNGAIRAAFARPVEFTHQAARLSTEGVTAPHIVHNDTSMGSYTSLLYFMDEGGTAFRSHATLGFGTDPATEEQLAAWNEDTNTNEAWNYDFFCPAKRNKMLIYPSAWMHNSEPVGGSGSDASDGRLVIATWFKVQ